jgi:hypothetical protein
MGINLIPQKIRKKTEIEQYSVFTNEPHPYPFLEGEGNLFPPLEGRDRMGSISRENKK